ncbi:MAG: hypothetical protein Ct9H300mP15_30490 [Gemmatimonadota bacterium]|nr:MAG: hypothetical protein Ct9H300mP15_30490 [Gemmatimonadota bacterium]
MIASALRDAGFEVIYTGLHQTPEMIVNAAVQEDVQIVSMSILSGAHMTFFQRSGNSWTEPAQTIFCLPVVGLSPGEDIEDLESRGIGRLFGPGTPTTEIIDYIQDWFGGQETS